MPTTAKPQDAIALLEADHREAEDLFEQFEKATSRDRKVALAREVCKALRVHMQAEEEIFYPAARDVLKDDDIVLEGIAEHDSAKDVIAEIEAMDGSEELYDSKVHVLSEHIEHHVSEEEEDMFPDVKKTDLDLKELGARIAARKAELMGEPEKKAA